MSQTITRTRFRNPKTQPIIRHTKLWQCFNDRPGGRAGEMAINGRYSVAKGTRAITLNIVKDYPLI